MMTLLLIASAMACERAGAVPASLPPTETIVGRARWQGKLVLLTDGPALVTIEPAGGVVRVPVEGPRGAFDPWGLAESDGKLFTVAGFSTLMQVSADGAVSDPVPLELPLTNLVDLPDGMAVQAAGANAGASLLMHVNGAGRLLPLRSPPRRRFGLTAAEENLLHLLSCSAPPQVICWLPNDDHLFAFDNDELREVLRLADLRVIADDQFLQNLDLRVITDALVSAEGEYLVLHDDAGSSAVQMISSFDADGRKIGAISAPEPLRLLVAATAREAEALSRAGYLLRMPRS